MEENSEIKVILDNIHKLSDEKRISEEWCNMIKYAPLNDMTKEMEVPKTFTELLKNITILSDKLIVKQLEIPNQFHDMI